MIRKKHDLAPAYFWLGVLSRLQILAYALIHAKAKSTRTRSEDKSLVLSTLWCEYIAKTFKVDVESCPF